MKNRLVNHSWHSMLNGDPSAKVFVEAKIEEVRSITREVEEKEGKQVAKNVLHDGLILHALKRMHEYLEGSSTISEEDFYIYYGYATKQAEHTERIIDSELAHLGL